MRIVFSGYYGFRNAGDEAVLAGLLRLLAQADLAHPGDIVVLSADPGWSRAQHGVEAVDRWNMRAVSSAIAASDLLISGGGSLLQDTTSLRSLLYYAWIMRKARALKRPYMLCAQGIGPLRRSISRRIVYNAANRSAAITVRDEASAELLRDLGIATDRIRVTADPAYALDAPQPRPEPRERPTIGFALRPWHDRDIARACRPIAQKLSAAGIGLIGIAMHPALDAPVCAETLQGLSDSIVDTAGDPQAALQAIHGVEGLIGMRLHAIILSAVCSTAPTAIAYDPKVTATMRALGLEDYRIDLDALDADVVVSRALTGLADRESILQRIGDKLTYLRQSAAENVAMAAAAAGSGVH